MKIAIPVVAVVVLLLVACPQVKADAPYELYSVPKSSISIVVLRDSIGVLTLSSDVKGGKDIPTYKVSGSSFTSDAILKALETVPVSNFDYHPPDDPKLIGSYRYPILKKTGTYLLIVVDPVKATRVWVNVAELGNAFILRQTYFNDLAHLGELYVDPFFGEVDVSRPIYKTPSLATETGTIPKGSYKVKAEKNGFVELLVEEWSEQSEHPELRTVGWIPIRDAAGLLTIWVVLYDNC